MPSPTLSAALILTLLRGSAQPAEQAASPAQPAAADATPAPSDPAVPTPLSLMPERSNRHEPPSVVPSPPPEPPSASAPTRAPASSTTLEPVASSSLPSSPSTAIDPPPSARGTRGSLAVFGAAFTGVGVILGTIALVAHHRATKTRDARMTQIAGGIGPLSPDYVEYYPQLRRQSNTAVGTTIAASVCGVIGITLLAVSLFRRSQRSLAHRSRPLHPGPAGVIAF